MNNNLNNKKGGFLQLIVLIIVGLIILKFFNLSISDVFYSFKTFFSGVLR